jgi:hypothetical protein
MWMGSLLKWWTTNKIDTDAYIGKSRYFQVAHSIMHSNMGCGVSSPCNDHIKLDENLVNLIWANKVSYAKGFRDVWDNQNWTRSSSKKEHKKEIIWLVNHHELQVIHGW